MALMALSLQSTGATKGNFPRAIWASEATKPHFPAVCRFPAGEKPPTPNPNKTRTKHPPISVWQFNSTKFVQNSWPVQSPVEFRQGSSIELAVALKIHSFSSCPNPSPA